MIQLHLMQPSRFFLRPFLLTLALAMGVGLTCRSKAASVFEIIAVESPSVLTPIVVGNGGFGEDSTNLFQNAGVAASWTGSDPTSAAAYVERMVSNDARDSAASVYLMSISLGNSQGRNDSLLSAIEIWQALAGSGENQIIIEDDRYRGRRGDLTLSGSGQIGQGWFSDPTPGGGIPLAPGNSPGTLSFGDGSFVSSSGTQLNLDLTGDVPLIDFSNSGLVQSIPEPSSLLIGAFGVLGLLRRRRDS